jgi:hypothetical protein
VYSIHPSFFLYAFYSSVIIFYLHTGLVIVTMLPDSLGRFGFNVKGGCDQVSTTATYSQRFGSGSGLDPDSIRSVDPDSIRSVDPDPDPGGQK